MEYGFIKVASAVPSVKVGDVRFNNQQIESIIVQAEGMGVEIIVFPELSITGYSCQDLFHQQLLLDAAENSLMMLLNVTRQLDIIAIVGLPVVVGDLLLNCAAVIQKGKLLGLVPKTYLPEYSEFYEKRWFASAQDVKQTEIRFAGHKVLITPDLQLFTTSTGATFGVEICEDVWAPTPPSNGLALAGAQLIFNLSASDELSGKHAYLKSLLSNQSARTMTGYIYSSCGFGESTQDVVYGGNALIYENGHLLAESERFSLNSQLEISQIDIEKLQTERRCNSTYVNAQCNIKYAMQESGLALHHIVAASPDRERDFVLERTVDSHPFIPKEEDRNSSCEEILNIQVSGLAKRVVHTHVKTVVLGISGGLDSTLALLVCVKTFDRLGMDRKNIIGVTMPGFGTTDRTHHNAVVLMKSLGVTVKEINISKAVTQHFEDIGHDINVHDVTYENGQARERTQILMDLANQMDGLVIGTGDLSEMALGWSTYNGDHMSMYGVNGGVPKTLIQFLLRHIADHSDDETSKTALLDIINTPISPELIPADENGEIKQKTEDLVGPYELHDFFLYYFLRFGFRPGKIFLLAKKAFIDQQVKGKSVEHKTVSGAELGGSYDEATIKKWLKVFLRRFFSQQFKRSCLPDGPKVGSVSLSPRGDWRMPSDASSNIWLEEVDSL
ncbi:MAG: NAD(+) synthase [Prevotella sp.]|jgi:NAD+ synthase (glutamine-hydrolysing)|uniref:Glutamine-dependent NAD(+) synthetase n=1 Tax=Segatella cerevisiae TaxID=2053716 RepID=A0ABT1BXR0_9BACT|nr:NAD(+) synthase [Segatella cerevisiae]MCH3995668.1 NAD(+) synthase [Prevotella sp.]MCI1246967.1 NAD(+) synthase [Prevotella sp.]MCO6025874.1 NAD(+) synthase [Segatella cerevisiae]